MKSFSLATSVGALFAVLVAVPAAPQTTTGQVAVRGFVAPRCGTASGDASFNGTINLGELTQANGTLSAALSGSSANGPAGVASFIIGCTGGSSTVTLGATRLSNPVAPHIQTSSNDIDYTAQVRIALAEGGFATVDYTTAAALPSPTVAPIASTFAYVSDNFEVRVFALTPENGASSLLVAGNYDSTITITVSPAS
jgi:hypothetical protein